MAQTRNMLNSVNVIIKMTTCFIKIYVPFLREIFTRRNRTLSFKKAYEINICTRISHDDNKGSTNFNLLCDDLLWRRSLKFATVDRRYLLANEIWVVL